MTVKDARALAVRSIPDRVPPENRTLGWQIFEWAVEYLRQPDGASAGEPWVFTDEQARVLARWFAIDARGRFVYRRGVLRRLKGHGKDPFCAALSAIELCGPCRFGGFDAEGVPVAVAHPAPWVQVAAVSQDQTRNTMTLFAGLFSAAAIDEFGLEIGRTLVYSRTGQIEAVTSSPRALEGRRATFMVLNETQNWLESNDGVAMSEVIARNLAKSNDGSARSMEINNAHLPGEDSVAERTYEAWRQAGGKVPGLMYDSVEAPPIADLSDRAAVRAGLLAARGDSHWLNVDRLLDEIADPGTPAYISRRYYLNQVIAVDGERWMPMDLWDRCARPGHEIPDHADVVLGFDGSRTGDSTALVAVRIADRDQTPHLAAVQCWENTSRRPDWEVPMEPVMDEIRAACKRWRVREIAADPSYWSLALQILAAERLPVVAFPQTAVRMNPAAAALRQAACNGLLTHDGDPDLRRHVSNAVLQVSTHGGKLAKDAKSSPRRIDLAVAAVMALARSRDFKPRRGQIISLDRALAEAQAAEALT